MTFNRVKLLPALGLAMAIVAGPAAMAEETLNVAGSGGGLAQVIKGVFDDPFTAATGIKINALATSNRASALKAMMAAGRTTWDISELNPIDYATASLSGWLMPLDWARIDPDNMLPANAKLTAAGISATYSTILAVRTDKLPDGKTMRSWADFWDVETFPGPRAQQNQPIDNLEFALLADGVAPGDIYTVLATPEGIDRAFAKLDEIKPHVVAWWTAGAQPVQMLSDGEVDYTSAWLAIIKGTEKQEIAEQYLRFFLTDPKRAAQFVSMVPYPPLVNGLYDEIDPVKGKILPTHPDNVAGQFVTDAVFWGQNLSAIKERWQEWILE